MRKVLILFLFAFGLLCAGMALIVVTGLRDHITDADLIVVPGNAVAPDGTPSPRLKARLDAALLLYQAHHAPRVFVSSGTGMNGVDEARAMARYLERHAVPASAIVIDSQGVTTAATAENAASFMRQNHLTTALVATQYFHIARTKMALERNGVQVTGSLHPRYFEGRDFYSTFREAVAYVVYFFRLTPSQ